MINNNNNNVVVNNNVVEAIPVDSEYLDLRNNNNENRYFEESYIIDIDGYQVVYSVDTNSKAYWDGLAKLSKEEFNKKFFDENGHMRYGKVPLLGNQNSIEDFDITNMVIDENDPVDDGSDVDPSEIPYIHCDHTDNGISVLIPINDGTGDYYCPFCHARVPQEDPEWIALRNLSKEEFNKKFFDENGNTKDGRIPVLGVQTPVFYDYDENDENCCTTIEDDSQHEENDYYATWDKDHCDHKFTDGTYAVAKMNNDKGEVYCFICHKKWTPFVIQNQLALPEKITDDRVSEDSLNKILLIQQIDKAKYTAAHHMKELIKKSKEEDIVFDGLDEYGCHLRVYKTEDVSSSFPYRADGSIVDVHESDLINVEEINDDSGNTVTAYDYVDVVYFNTGINIYRTYRRFYYILNKAGELVVAPTVTRMGKTLDDVYPLEERRAHYQKSKINEKYSGITLVTFSDDSTVNYISLADYTMGNNDNDSTANLNSNIETSANNQHYEHTNPDNNIPNMDHLLVKQIFGPDNNMLNSVPQYNQNSEAMVNCNIPNMQVPQYNQNFVNNNIPNMGCCSQCNQIFGPRPNPNFGPANCNMPNGVPQFNQYPNQSSQLVYF